MIKALGRSAHDTPLVLLGLTGENLTRLLADEPILIDLAELGLPACKISIIYGTDEKAIIEKLVRAGLLEPTS